MSNDIALVELAEPMKFDDSHRPAKLFEENEDIPVGKFGEMVGWGYNEKGIIPEVAQRIKLRILSKELCDLGVNLFCAGPTDDDKEAFPKTGCQGDSGCPLLVDGRVVAIAIASEVVPCGSGKTPTVFIEVSKYRSWMNKIINKKL